MKLAAKLIGLHIIQILVIFLFCFGYFPRKPILKDISVYSEDDYLGPVFEKLVLVVIDALRSDFLYYNDNSKFHSIHQLINDGKGIGFTAFANPPTVTLPRLKGITTGSTPIFLDAILNVIEGDDSSNLKEHDSILKQFSLANKKINFYGDDTWLKLFGEDIFNEFEGTSSFFVKDFTEVDNNVTRHIQPNLDNKDNWDVLILHYLGLDHIGHALGSSPPEMDAKQQELDSIIKTLYDSIDENSLLVIMGDHGMTDSGNHGGSTKSETNAGMCFLSKKFNLIEEERKVLPIAEKNSNYEYLTKIQQVDLVPTLMSLFGLPIPKNNVGVIIEDLLKPFYQQGQMQKLQEQNMRQLGNLINSDNKNESVEPTIKNMVAMQNKLMESATNYNYPILYTGIVAMGLVFMVNLCFTFEMNVPYFLVVSLSLVLGISSFATSFIEEEHKVWFWLLMLFIISANLVFQPITYTNSINTLGLLFFIRILKSWNNSGQKFFYYDLISNYLESNEVLCWVMNLVTVLSVSFMYKVESSFNKTIHLLASLLLFIYKINWEMKNSSLDWNFLGKMNLIFNNEEMINVARTLFKIFSVTLFINKVKKPLNKKFQLATITLILILQSSVVNVPMFTCFIIIEHFIENSDLQIENKLLVEMLLEHLSFFCFGNTNSIATIDLINAYNGVSVNYDIKVVGFLMMTSTFAPSIFFSLQQSSRDYCLTLKNSLLLSSLWGFLFLLSCFIGRYHLFVWSVFSPKLCYFLAWNIFMNLVVKVLLPLLIF